MTIPANFPESGNIISPDWISPSEPLTFTEVLPEIDYKNTYNKEH